MHQGLRLLHVCHVVERVRARAAPRAGGGHSGKIVGETGERFRAVGRDKIDGNGGTSVDHRNFDDVVAVAVEDRAYPDLNAALSAAQAAASLWSDVSRR